MKLTFALLLLTGMPLAAVTVILDSKDHPNLVTTGSQATFGAQGFRLSVAGAGTGDTVAANSPLAPTADLNSITAVRAPSGTATAGALFLKVFTVPDAIGTPIAISLNSIDVNGATALSDLVWNFNGEDLSTSTTYYMVWSTNNAADATGTDGVGARIAAANFGSDFDGVPGTPVNTAPGLVYGGTDNALRAYNAANPTPVVQGLDARFEISFNVVPEPSTALLGGIAALGLMRRRRR